MRSEKARLRVRPDPPRGSSLKTELCLRMARHVLSEAPKNLPPIENSPTRERASQISLPRKFPFSRTKMRADVGVVAQWSDDATAERAVADCSASARRCFSHAVSPEENSWARRKLPAANSLRPSFA